MNGANALNYEQAKTMLDQLYDQVEQVKTNLTKMNDYINENVNSGAGVWDGESASNFRTKWDALNDEIPEYISYFNRQVTNLAAMINETHKADEAE